MKVANIFRSPLLIVTLFGVIPTCWASLTLEPTFEDLAPSALAPASITVQFYQSGNLIATYAPTRSGNSYAVNHSETGEFDVFVKAPKYLSVTLENVRLYPTLPVGPFAFNLICGDIDGDEEVGASDFSRLSAAFLTTEGDPAWDPECDLDGDGEVGSSDLGILSNNYFAVGTSTRPLATIGRVFSFSLPAMASEYGLNAKDVRLVVGATQQSSISVTSPGITSTLNASVAPNSLTTLNLNSWRSSVANTTADGISGSTINLVSDRPISAMMLRPLNENSSAYSLLPLQSSGFDFVICAAPSLKTPTNEVVGESFLTVTAVVGTPENPTVVTIDPATDAGNNSSQRPARQPFQVTLLANETYQLFLQNQAGDLTGTIITSDKPINVVSGSSLTRMPVPTSHFAPEAANPVVETQLPTDLHGSSFVLAPFASAGFDPSSPGTTFGYQARIVASRNNTIVTVNTKTSAGVPETFTVTLHRGEFCDREIIGAAFITSSKPVQVVQFSLSKLHPASGGLGDPEGVVVPSSEHFQQSSLVMATKLGNTVIPAHSGYAGGNFDWANFVTIFVNASQIDTSSTTSPIRHFKNGADIGAVPGNLFHPIPGNSGFVYARLRLDNPANDNDEGLHEFADTSVFPGKVYAFVHSFDLSTNHFDAWTSFGSFATRFNGGIEQAPAAPVLTSAIATSTSDVSLTWSHSGNNIDGFFVERKTVLGGVWTRLGGTFGPTERTASVTGLQKRTGYLFRVIAFNDQNSPLSNVLSATTWDDPPLTPNFTLGEDYTLASGPQRIKLTWHDPSYTATNRAEFFDIEVLINNQWQPMWDDIPAQPVSHAYSREADVPVLQADTVYSFRVRSYHTAGVARYSDWGQCSLRTTKLSPPSFTATATATAWNEISITWPAIGNGGNNEEDGFRIYRKDAAGEFQLLPGGELPADTQQFMDSALTGSTLYQYRVVAYNNNPVATLAGCSATTLTPPPPMAVTNFTATGVTSTTILLSWSVEDSSVEDFELKFRRRLPDLTWDTWIGPTHVSKSSRTYSVFGLMRDTSYEFELRSRNSLAIPPIQLSVPTLAQGTTLSAPQRPITIEAYPASASSVRLYWPTVSDATHYRVYRSTMRGSAYLSGTALALIPQASSEEYQQFLDTGLFEGVDYYYTVVSVSGDYESLPCGESVATPVSGAIPWEGSEAEITSTAVALSGLSNLNLADLTILSPRNRLIKEMGTQVNPAVWGPDLRNALYNDYSFPTGGDTGSLSPDDSDTSDDGPAEGGYHKEERVFDRETPLQPITTRATWFVPAMAPPAHNYFLPPAVTSPALWGPAYLDVPHVYVGFTDLGHAMEGGMALYGPGVGGVNQFRWTAFLRGRIDGQNGAYYGRNRLTRIGMAGLEWLPANKPYQFDVKMEIFPLLKLVAFDVSAYDTSWPGTSFQGRRVFLAALGSIDHRKIQSPSTSPTIVKPRMKVVTSLAQAASTSGRSLMNEPITAVRTEPTFNFAADPGGGQPSRYFASGSKFTGVVLTRAEYEASDGTGSFLSSFVIPGWTPSVSFLANPTTRINHTVIGTDFAYIIDIRNHPLGP